MSLAELLVATTDWHQHHELTGAAGGVGIALANLLSASDAEKASDAYWRLENHVVVQGEVYEAALPCTIVLCAALAEPRPIHVRISALELLFQILAGHASPSSNTPPDIIEQCRVAALEGLWSILREASFGVGDAAWDVLEKLLPENRLQRYRKIANVRPVHGQA